MSQSRLRHLFLAFALLLALVAALPSRAQSPSVHLALGNPSGATTDENQPANYLLLREQYAVGYTRDDGIPRWVSWRLIAADVGPVPRYSGNFGSLGISVKRPIFSRWAGARG